MRRYMVVLEQGETNWSAHVPDLPGCVAAAETREATLTLIREAVALHIDMMRQSGETIPRPTCEIDFVDVEAA